MPGVVIFALTERQAAVLQHLRARRPLSEISAADRIAFFALARRGLVRGALEHDSACLTIAGEAAAQIAAAFGRRRRGTMKLSPSIPRRLP